MPVPFENTDAGREFIASAKRLGTSPEIMAEIARHAGNRDDALEIWRWPSEIIRRAVWASVTGFGRRSAAEFVWRPSGVYGENWWVCDTLLVEFESRRAAEPHTVSRMARLMLPPG